MRILPILMFVLTALALPAASLAQGAFSPVAKVNDRVITGFELEQRILLNQLLRAPGDLDELSLEQLIDDRLRLDAAQAAGVSISEEAVDAGMEEFASRAQLTKDEFVAAIGQAGVEEATFRDFVRAGAAWRHTAPWYP